MAAMQRIFSILLPIFLGSAISRAATVLEAALAIPFPMADGSTGYLVGGSAFFRIDGDQINYQIWLSRETTLLPKLSISGVGGDTALALEFLGVQEIHGCE